MPLGTSARPTVPRDRADPRHWGFCVHGPLVDRGSGAGGQAVEFASKGFPVTAVDLSARMLRRVAAKADRAGLEVHCVQANLCRLGLADKSFSYAISMFSTLGMIRGASARRRALAEAYRILRPGGGMALHAHNPWPHLRDPRGRFWLMGPAPRGLGGRPGGGAARRRGPTLRACGGGHPAGCRAGGGRRWHATRALPGRLRSADRGGSERRSPSGRLEKSVQGFPRVVGRLR